MNLGFSSAILVLAQYFHKRHCLATTLAMVGTGVGIFVMSQVIERVIEAYGWRISYIFCAGVSLQLCICGALMLPLPESALAGNGPENGLHEDRAEENEDVASQQHSESDYSGSDDEEDHGSRRGGMRTRRALRRRRGSRNQHIYYQKDLINKSFSSLMLSAQAGYLSHSLASLGPRTPSMLSYQYHHHHLEHDHENSDAMSHNATRRPSGGHRVTSSSHQHQHDKLSRNNDSFFSRTSSIMPYFLRSSQLSVNSKSSVQPSATGLRSGHASKVSLKDSRLDLLFHGLKSNPHSFSLRMAGGNDQREETEQLCGKLDDLLEEDRSSSEEAIQSNKFKMERESFLKKENEEGKSSWDAALIEKGAADGHGAGLEKPSRDEKKASFLISGGESEEDEDDDDARSNGSDMEYDDGSDCNCCRRIQDLGSCVASIRFTPDPVMKEVGMWCFAFAYFFTILGTMTIYVIFTDFTAYLGLADYSSLAMSAAGIGDLIGRFTGGMMAAGKVGNSVILYGLSMVMSAVILALFLFITNGTVFVAAVTLYGVMFGAQNIYIAVTPNDLFGREKLARVFGISVFLAGIAGLIGSPLAGMVADLTGGYAAVVLLEGVCCLIGSALVFICFILNRRKKSKETANGLEVPDKQRTTSQNDCILRAADGSKTNEAIGTHNRLHSDAQNRESQLLQNMKLIRQSLNRVNKQHKHNNSDGAAQSSETNRVNDNIGSSSGGTTSKNHTIINMNPELLTRGHRRPSLSSMHSNPSRPRLGSYSRPAQQETPVLKRTSTCDSILNKKSSTPHHTPPGERRFTMCATTRPSTKKKTTSLYEEVLGKKYSKNNGDMYTQSDQNLAAV